MATRRFGPTQDAGTTIIEKESEKTIQASKLGSTAYPGVLERGPVGEVITCVGKKDMLKKTGGLIPDSLLPDCCQDFWDHSEGAGTLFLYRVTDGLEVAAFAQFRDRTSARNPVMKVEANNGGGWAGKRDTVVADMDDESTDITSETTVKLPDLYVVSANKWKGGTITFTETGLTYNIVSNTEGDGITGAVVTVTADSTMLTDFGAGTDPEVILIHTQIDVWGRDKRVSIVIKDGEISPTTEWGMEVYVDDELVKTYADLNSDPNADNYYVEIINRDTSNYYITVTDLWVGAVTADTRPANWYGVLADTEIAEKVLTLSTDLFEVIADLSGGDTSSVGSFTFPTTVRTIKDNLILTYTGTPTDWTVESGDKMDQHAFANAVAATPYVADNNWSFGFTITEVGPTTDDTLTVYCLALVEDEAIGGKIFFPDESSAPARGWDITDNTENTVTITSGDLTIGGTISGNIDVRLEYKQELEYGFDGDIAGIDVNDFLPAYDVNNSPFNDLLGQDWGLIKFATPSVTDMLTSGDATTVEKAGEAYANAKNCQYRYEIPESVTDEVSAKSHVNDTLGRSDYTKVIFPSYADVADPVLTQRLKTIPITGMVHGREAKTARDYDGYHKSPAGIVVTLPRIRELPTGDTKLDGELLNGAGLQRVEIKKGNFVVWGGRAPSLTTSFKFAHHREQLSHYEHVLIGSFDYVIFALNDESEQAGLIAALQSFFLPEWRKRALQGSKLSEGAAIKIDEENNTPATRAAGDMNADVTVWQADMIERFVISIGKKGVFESVAAA